MCTCLQACDSLFSSSCCALSVHCIDHGCNCRRSTAVMPGMGHLCSHCILQEQGMAMLGATSEASTSGRAPNALIVSSLSHADHAASRMSAEYIQTAAVINDRRCATLLRSQSLMRRPFSKRAYVVRINLGRRQAMCLCEGWSHSECRFPGQRWELTGSPKRLSRRTRPDQLAHGFKVQIPILSTAPWPSHAPCTRPWSATPLSSFPTSCSSRSSPIYLTETWVPHSAPASALPC